MEVVIKFSAVAGVITAPPSKSAMQRACAAALLRSGKTILHNPGVSADDTAALNIITQLGAVVQHVDEKVVIVSDGVRPIGGELNCGESGLSARMFTSVAALSNQPIIIKGQGSLVKRPFDFFTEVLPQLGVQCSTNAGLLPLHLQGPIQPKNIVVDGSLSSQFLTGLLFAFSAAGATAVSIHVTNLASKPYIDMTLETMRAFGLKTPVNKDYKEFYFDNTLVEQGGNELQHIVEGDWSGAAFLLVAGAVAGSVTVKQLKQSSAQADKKILEALSAANAPVQLNENGISVTKSSLTAFDFDATQCPDLFPPLVALAAYCNGRTTIAGVHRLTHKESNRALTLQQEFGKLAVPIELHDNVMVVQGGGKINGADVSSHHDHRIAMACAVAALGADGPVTIDGAEAVNKSYPQFWQHLSQLTSHDQ